jgi:hypothetical protein
MAYYKVTMKGGHQGAGKSYDFVRYYEAEDMVSAYLNALSLARVKKNVAGTGVYAVEPVSGEEFLMGKIRERRDPYLRRRV